MDEPLDDRCKTWTVKHARPIFILDLYCKLWTLVQKYGRYKEKCGKIFIEFNFNHKLESYEVCRWPGWYQLCSLVSKYQIWHHFRVKRSDVWTEYILASEGRRKVRWNLDLKAEGRQCERWTFLQNWRNFFCSSSSSEGSCTGVVTPSCCWFVETIEDRN